MTRNGSKYCRCETDTEKQRMTKASFSDTIYFEPISYSEATSPPPWPLPKVVSALTVHSSSLSKTIKVIRTSHTGHCWGSKDEPIRHSLKWAPSYGRASVDRPSRTYLQQLSAKTGCTWKTSGERWMIGTDRDRDRERKRERGRETGKSVLAA